MKKDQIRAYIKEPQQDWVEKEVSNTLEALQELVGGHIETIDADGRFCLIVNEEGRLRDLPFNTIFGQHDLYGTIVAVGLDGEEFMDAPLPLETWQKLFRKLAGTQRTLCAVTVEVSMPRERYINKRAVELRKREMMKELARRINVSGAAIWTEHPSRKHRDGRELKVELFYATLARKGIPGPTVIGHISRQMPIARETAEDVVEHLNECLMEALVNDLNRAGELLWQHTADIGVYERLRCFVRVAMPGEKAAGN